MGVFIYLFFLCPSCGSMVRFGCFLLLLLLLVCMDTGVESKTIVISSRGNASLHDGGDDRVGRGGSEEEQDATTTTTVRMATTTDVDQYHIPRWYIIREKPMHYDDTQISVELQRFYQGEVYAYVKQLMETHPWWTRVTDVGCGTGRKLVEVLGTYETVGIETEPALSYLRSTYPDRTWLESGEPEKSFVEHGKKMKTDVLVCSDVVEHIINPDSLLEYLKTQFEFKRLVISTPDREYVHKLLVPSWPTYTGPPANLAHVREWTAREFHDYLSDHFEVLRSFRGTAEGYCQWHECVPQKKKKEEKRGGEKT